MKINETAKFVRDAQNNPDMPIPVTDATSVIFNSDTFTYSVIDNGEEAETSSPTEAAEFIFENVNS